MATTTKPRKTKATAKATEVKPKATKKATTKAATAKKSASTGKRATASATKATAAKTTKASTAKATKAAGKSTPKAVPVTKAAKSAPKGKTGREPKATPTGEGRALNVHGFVPGGDSDLIVRAMIEGGADRAEINAAASAAIAKTNGLATRAGAQKNVPSLTSALLKRLQEKGYTVESHWKVVPPKEVQDAMKKEAAAEKRRAARASKK